MATSWIRSTGAKGALDGVPVHYEVQGEDRGIVVRTDAGTGERTGRVSMETEVQRRGSGGARRVTLPPGVRRTINPKPKPDDDTGGTPPLEPV